MYSTLSKIGLRTLASLAICLGLLAGCATDEKNEFAGWSVEKLYNEGRDQMNAGDYTRSAQVLEATIAQYPFSAQATQAQLELPYVYWKDENRLKALASADRFITLNGSHPQLDYMYYLKGLINSQNNTNYLKSLLTREVTGGNDPKASSEAFDSFKTLVTRFPNSRYAPDARKRMVTLVNSLAQQELNVAEYYYSREAYLAAISRAQNVLQNFDGTPAVETALVIMVKSYDALNMQQLRGDTQRVLNANYPNSKMQIPTTPVPTATTTQSVEVPKPQ